MIQRMTKRTFIAIIFVFHAADAIAGPSYSVECEDIARGTKLHLFDANPRSGIVDVTGTHNQLPDGLESFSAVDSNDNISLTVADYKPYEVQLLLSPAQPLVASLHTDNEHEIELGHLQKVILENHSEIVIDSDPRLAATILVMQSGVRLRFNGCRIRGDAAVLNWQETFD